jgi:hypothetical protein
MKILKWLGGAIGILALLFIASVMIARSGDGPTGLLPGGELVTVEPDWTFARDIPEMELQLVEPPQSRTVCL